MKSCQTIGSSESEDSEEEEEDEDGAENYENLDWKLRIQSPTDTRFQKHMS